MELFLKRVELFDLSEETRAMYPFTLHAVKNIEQLTFNKPVTILIGENGVVKSTLIEAIAVAAGFNAEGGNKDSNFTTFNSSSELHKYLRLIKSPRRMKNGYFLRSETLYNFKSSMTAYHEDTGKQYHNTSHGESVIQVLERYFQEEGFYILDEPEAALSPTSQFKLLYLINYLAQKTNSQFIIATHSPILASYKYAELIEITEDTMHVIPGFKETSLYHLYARFLEHPGYQDEILGENDVEI